MSKVPLTLLLVLCLSRHASAQNEGSESKGSAESNQSTEQLRELEIDELIRSLEQRINAKEAISREAYDADVVYTDDYQKDRRSPEAEKEPQQCGKENVFQDRTTSSRSVHPNPRDRKSLYATAVHTDQDAKAGTQAVTDETTRHAKRKISENENLDEIRKEAYGIRNDRTLHTDSSVNDNQLSDFEKDEQYYRALLRLQNLYRLYNKRFLDDELSSDDRTSRHCTDALVGKKMDLIQSSRLRYLERSRLLADRIAETAMRLVRRKSGRVLDNLLHPGCGFSGRQTIVESIVPDPVLVAEAEPIVVLEEATKRDVEVSAASSASASVGASIDAGGVSVDAGLDASVASSASVATGLGGGGVSIGHRAGIASDLRVGAGIGAGASLSAGIDSQLNVGLGAHRGIGLLGQLSSCEDYERKMVMDMAIEEAAGMIRKLAIETRGEVGYNDPEYERRVLGLAIDLVNKVTGGVTGDIGGKLDVLGDLRYNNVDEYLKSSIFEGELETDLISNSGFDYVNRYRDLGDLDALEDYVGHASPFSRGRCDSCSKYDLRMGNMCPLCKRSGHMFHGRVKRRPDRANGKGKIYHLQDVPNKVNIK